VLLNLDFRRFREIVFGTGMSRLAPLKPSSLSGAKVSLLSIIPTLVLDSGIPSSGCASAKLSIVGGGDNGVSW
jgi:hypothetical protein